jgi:phage tail protein X
MRDETVTNTFWGLFLVWFGIVSAVFAANFGAAIESPLFALGTGVLLLVMNLVRNLVRLRVSIITTGLGILLAIVYFPLYFLGKGIPFLPALIIIAGVALVIGAFRSRRYYV